MTKPSVPRTSQRIEGWCAGTAVGRGCMSSIRAHDLEVCSFAGASARTAGPASRHGNVPSASASECRTCLHMESFTELRVWGPKPGDEFIRIDVETSKQDDT